MGKTSLRIALDPDALRWTPTPPSGIIFDSPLKSSPSGAESGEEKEEEEEVLKKGERRKLPRRQILSTESESECALSGECADLTLRHCLAGSAPSQRDDLWDGFHNGMKAELLSGGV